MRYRPHPFSVHLAIALLALHLASILALGCDTQRPLSQNQPEDTGSPTESTQAPPVAKPSDVTPGQSPAPTPVPDDADDDALFRRDIRRICHVMEESGANQLSEAEHPLTVARWLGSNITSEPGRAFLARLARTPPDGKASLLRAAGKQAGVADCPLARTWDTAAPGTENPDVPN